MTRINSRRIQNRADRLQDSTLRDFSGGLNVIDNDLNLSPRFATVLENMYRRPDGSIGLRFGTRLFSDTQVRQGYKYFVNDGVADDELSEGSAFTIATTNTSQIIQITLDDANDEHYVLLGELVDIANWNGGTVGGITRAMIQSGPHPVTAVPSNKVFSIDVGFAATATTSVSSDGNIRDWVSVQTVSDIIHCVYFQDHIITVQENGEVRQVGSDGIGRLIWSTTLAAAQAGAPTAWSTGLTFCSSAVFAGKLLLANGIDKPLEIDLNPTTHQGIYCQYIVDVLSGSNLNTPVCRHVIAMDRYVIMAGDPVNIDRIHISNIDTYGTWLNDSAPNDAVIIDMSKRVKTVSPEVRGINRFRDNLIIGFDDGTAVMQVGIYTDDATPLHVPNVTDFIENFGCISHHSMQSIGDDFFQADHIGVPSIQRALFTGGIRAERASQLIDPNIQNLINTLSVAQTDDKMFSLYNPRDNQYMLFVPNAGETERTVFVYTVIRTLKVAAWSEFKGWNFRSGCTSLLGRVFFSEGMKLYTYGSEIDDAIYGDKIDDAAITDPTNGDDIEFEWELPWGDFDQRNRSKMNRYVRLETQGEATFCLKTYVDNIKEAGSPAVDSPVLIDTFVGGEAGGWGQTMTTGPFGGGRRTRDERLWSWPVKGNIFKHRFFGTTTDNIQFISLSFLYNVGSIRR